ncbi:DUF2125 domain-containing protein [Pseudogemmobacter faecipullorum]|uniref:DUF2125 domain-containing protein n=1 Tax=Pseudogemmobacter faecipullorum TaxID=2755041 RepID=A0ABS8CHS6_9RHOB|nr:DUF2125 domain-containing protein [Pseudogemmobacter faecipullorum]MCB5408946.1 DUF2125 domain-containing protein [Pseudogemmobacter faecipullorum]
MRRLMGFFVVLVVLWCGWWFLGRALILREAKALIADQRNAGAEISYSDLGLRGFASRFDLTARDLRYRDPGGRFGFEGPVVWLYAMSWKPWHIILGLPERQKLFIAGQMLELEGRALQASLRAAPALDLPLAELRLSGEAITLRGAGMGEFTAGGVSLGLRDASALPDAGLTGGALYQLGLNAGELRPDAAIAAKIAAVTLAAAPAEPLPEVISALHLDLILSLTAPLDRHAGQSQPGVTALNLRDLSLTWGALELSASGMLLPDAQGYASGRITVTAKNWQYLPVLMVASGKVEPRMAPLLQNMLAALAQDAGTPDQISLPLVLKDGWMNFGPLPLAAAPNLAQPGL